MDSLKVWTLDAYTELLKYYKVQITYLAIGHKIEKIEHKNEEKECGATTAIFTAISSNHVRLEFELLYFDDEFSDVIIDPLEKIIDVSRCLHQKQCKIFAGYVSGKERSIPFAINPLTYLKRIETFEGSERKNQAKESFAKIFDDLEERFFNDELLNDGPLIDEPLNDVLFSDGRFNDTYVMKPNQD